MKSFLIAAVIALSAGAAGAADCIDQAAARFHTNAGVLRAIAIVESRARPDATHLNTNGSVDRGLYQINSIHLRELSTAGISPADLHDVCLSSHVASLLLKRQIRKFGDTWTAVGAYHSNNPVKRDAYARKVREVFEIIARFASQPSG